MNDIGTGNKARLNRARSNMTFSPDIIKHAAYQAGFHLGGRSLCLRLIHGSV